MPGATPVYGLPYPIGTDRLDDAVTTIPEDLALQLESTLQGFGGIAAPGSWNTLTLAVGSAYGGGFQSPRYRKIGNVVYVQGLVGGLGGGLAAGTTIATLPVGFRPPADLVLPSAMGVTAQFCRIDVLATGVIRNDNGVPAGTWLSINLPPFTVD